MNKTTFIISKLDCPSEENLIKLKLDGHDYVKLEFDIARRTLIVYHYGSINAIFNALKELKLGCQFVDTVDFDDSLLSVKLVSDRVLLWYVLFINALMFVFELLAGCFSNSMGLIADSLDMLADAIVYGLSIYSVGKIISVKKKVAKLSGYLQLFLAFWGMSEVIKRFVYMYKQPDYKTMIIVSIIALLGNVFSLFLLQKSKSKEVNMKASMIFTSNDIIVNFGVIVAGILVYVTKSHSPDLIIGSMVFLLVTNGAVRILKLAQ